MSDRITVVRYAPYVEDMHNSLLAVIAVRRNIAIEQSPPIDADRRSADVGFFAVGFAIGSFPSLCDMFGRLMAGFDVEEIGGRVLKKTLNRPEIEKAYREEVRDVRERIEKERMEYKVKMRNLNAVTSSSFIIGLSIIENSMVKQLSDLSLKMKTQLLGDVEREYRNLLLWQKDTIGMYALIMRSYYLEGTQYVESIFGQIAQQRIWPFIVLGFEGSALGVLQGEIHTRSEGRRRGRSTLSKMLLVASYVAQGAMIGSKFSPVGTAIGSGVGFVIGIASIFTE